MKVRDKMIRMMDLLLAAAEKISEKENATPEEIAVLPALANSLVHISGYAVIEPKEQRD